MTIIKDTFFGGAEKKASQAQVKSLEEGQRLTSEGKAAAEADLNRLFPQAGQALQSGFQGALDVFGQSLPQQTQAFQAGNVAAQNTLLASLPQFRNAILGQPVDFSGFQAFEGATPNFGFANQQIQAQNQPIQPQVIQEPQPQPLGQFRQFGGFSGLGNQGGFNRRGIN